MTGETARTSFLLRRLQLRIYNQMVAGLEKFEVTPFQYMALSLVSHSGRWSTADLARRFQITPQSMNEVIAALEAKVLVTRREAPDHRRILHVRLTSAGARLLQKCDLEIDRIESTVFRGFTPDELVGFREMLAKALSDADAGGQRSDLVVERGVALRQ